MDLNKQQEFLDALHIGRVLLTEAVFPHLEAFSENALYCGRGMPTMAEHIEKNPDRVEIKDLDLTASDLKDIPVVSVSQLITGVYGEDDGVIANVIVTVFGGFLALTALFTILKKPIAVMIFDLFTCGTFAFLNLLMKEDFIDPDKYAWGIGYYAIVIAFATVFAGAIWMLVKKIAVKKELKAERPVQPEA